MSISAFRETSFPSGRDKLLIGPARAGGSHGGPDALAPPELPEALDWPERVPVWESVHGPRLAVPRLEDAACQPRPDGPPRRDGDSSVPLDRPPGGSMGRSPSAPAHPDCGRPRPRLHRRHDCGLHTPRHRADGVSVRAGIRDRGLWSIAGCTGTANLFSGALFALFTLYAVRILGLDEVGIGTIGGIGGIGGILGAVTANRLANRIGIGRAIVLGIAAGSLSSFGVVFATPRLAFAFLIAMVFMGALGSLWYNINQVSLRQSLVPIRIQGRLNATMRFLVWGTLPIGSLLGGALGEVIGVYPAIVLAAAGGLLAGPWVFFSPVRHLMTIPPPAAD